jgi:hypothetical protein
LKRPPVHPPHWLGHVPQRQLLSSGTWLLSPTIELVIARKYLDQLCARSNQRKWYLQLLPQGPRIWLIAPQVVLAASITTRGGKAVLARAFHPIPRSRLEALLASFPRAAETGTQHTTVEDENVRFVYQPLDELYMVLITNKQSNILQDIDSLHLFAQVVTSTCKSLEEREILKNAYELLSAFDELVTLGYRENLTISQIKTFLEMESHEERIQEIIARVSSACCVAFEFRDFAETRRRTRN